MVKQLKIEIKTGKLRMPYLKPCKRLKELGAKVVKKRVMN